MVTVPRPREVFISYARVDGERVEGVVDGLQRMGASVWLDRAVAGGEQWWDEILEHVRDCDVFIQVISRASLGSEACSRERKYAQALGKPRLPVIVERVPSSLLPSDLALTQCIDYSGSSAEHAFALAGALSRCADAPPLPDPLPPAPGVPLSYLVELGEQARAETLTQDQQSALVARLRGALQDPEERVGAIQLLETISRRRDLYNSVAKDIDAALAEVKAGVPREPEPRVFTAPEPEPARHEPPRAQFPPPTMAPPQPPYPRIPSRMGRAIFALLLFLPTGIFSIIAASKVSSAVAVGDMIEAHKQSKRANVFFWVSLAIGVILFLWIVLAAMLAASDPYYY